MYQQPYPQQPHPQQQMPPQPGFGRLVVDTSFNPMNWFLFFKKPTLVINGHAREVEWGQVPVDLPAGQHNIQVSFFYLGKPRGVARATIPVQPGQVQPVFYRAPAHIMTGGALGPVRPATPGIGMTWAMMGVLFALLLLNVLIYV
ncbi:hypothetical protein, partial [Allokutzneria albata]